MQAMRDPAVDGILGSICPTAVTNVDAVVDVVIEVHDRYRRLGKPFIMECPVSYTHLGLRHAVGSGYGSRRHRNAGEGG